MNAITLWPEWTWAINLPGPLSKRVENRGFAIWPRLLNEWVAVHAGKHIGGKPGRGYTYGGLLGVRDMARLAGWESGVNGDPPTWALACRNGLDYGWTCSPDYTGKRPHNPMTPIVTSAIVGAFRVTRVLRPGETSDEDGIRGWKVPDAFGWVFDWRPCPPIPCGGKQGIWTWDGAL